MPILIGLGARELSMNFNSISRVKNVICGVAAEEAREVVKQISLCATADEVEDTVNKFFTANWAHLFSDELNRLFRIR